MIFSKLKDAIQEKSHTYEVHLTCLLIVVALVLISIACFGKPEHKALATLYIVL